MRHVLSVTFLVLLISTVGVAPVIAAPDGQVTWGVHRVEEPALGLITGYTFSGPYEDVKLKGK